MSLSLLALALVLGACDSATPSSSVDATVSSAPTAHASAEGRFVVSEAVQIEAVGEAVLLHVDGETFALSPNDAYFAGEALSRAGHATLDPKAAEAIGPGGDRCEPPPPGSFVPRRGEEVFAYGGGGGKCPPPPPPPFDEYRAARAAYGDGVEFVRVEDGLGWAEPVPGLFVARP
ncbi:hypothetical protein BSZ37_03845 [Rubrivirga marina]|uniref:Uncharacterized protein n=1 Tax=Rubrivirga marina TaxID=1196024 RepID=A0A271IXF9_9BACT|nr:hypothetical protein BSZ37_03845 [Rubrivirga marina]